MDCRSINSRLLRYIYGVLEGPELGLVRAHLDKCPACRQEAATVESTLKRLKRAAVHEPVPEGAKERILKEIRRKVN